MNLLMESVGMILLSPNFKLDDPEKIQVPGSVSDPDDRMTLVLR
jgi:hypothetical protein